MNLETVGAGTNSILVCPACGTPIQRAPHGRLTDGAAAHFKTVHPDRPNPYIRRPL